MRTTTIAISFLLLSCSMTSPASAQPSEKTIADYVRLAPFPMTIPALPQIADRGFNLTDYGAVGDGLTLNTAAFEKAIAACSAAGGGQIIVPPGSWLTGPILLKSNIDIHLLKGAMILFSRDHSLYPLVSSDGGKSFAPLPPLSGRDLDNIAITGEGIFDGGGDSWRPVKKEKLTAAQWKNLLASGGVLNREETIWWPSREALDGEAFLKQLHKSAGPHSAADFLPARDFLRPVLLQLSSCHRILLQGVNFQNAPKFAVYPGHCSDLTIDHITVFNEWWAQNGDGIDISACKKVLIYKSTVSAGDDAICLKSSGGSSANPNSSNSPTGASGSDSPEPALSDILIAACTVYHGHGGFVIGSNTDGGISNVAVSDCNFIGTDVGLRFKSNSGRGGNIKNIFISNIYMRDIANEAILFDTYYEDAPAGSSKDPALPKPAGKIPEFHDFHISNIYCSGARMAIHITGLPQMPVHDISLAHCVISAENGLIAAFAKNITILDTRLVTKNLPAYRPDPTAELRFISAPAQ